MLSPTRRLSVRRHDASSLDRDLNFLRSLERDQVEQERLESEFDRFRILHSRFIREQKKWIDWEKINPPPESSIKIYDDLSQPDTSQLQELLNSLAVVKLNGGLGTTMGCVGPKSVIEVRDDMSFLDLTVHQIRHLNMHFGCDVPLVLMNSFNTHEETGRIVGKYEEFGLSIEMFNQSRFPRIGRDSLLPVARSLDDNIDWYPPGHGDLYESLYNSGVLDKLTESGKEYLFISNIDNLGATVDVNILNFLRNTDENCEFIMEVTDKTRADVKGGTLIDYEGKLRLLEMAQVPPDNVDDFKSITKFRIFNTNNLWVKISAIKRLVESKMLSLEIIVNHKRRSDGINIVQLETAVGAAIKHFNHACGINVPRSRFLPVKSTSDLMLVKSNLYKFRDGTLVLNPARLYPSIPLVKLGHDFAKVSSFLSRFKTIPDILELDHVTVTGDVTFGKNVTLKGTVIIVANHGERINIPDCSLLENKVVSGSLRILDH